MVGPSKGNIAIREWEPTSSTAIRCTLDAIHLATTLLWKELLDVGLTTATHVSALGLAARAYGLPVARNQGEQPCHTSQ